MNREQIANQLDEAINWIDSVAGSDADQEHIQLMLKALDEGIRRLRNIPEVINVIVTKKGVVYENIATNYPEHAEEIFLDKCSEYISNWDEHTQEDIDSILEEGCYSNLSGVEIAINHADYRGD